MRHHFSNDWANESERQLPRYEQRVQENTPENQPIIDGIFEFYF